MARIEQASQVFCGGYILGYGDGMVWYGIAALALVWDCGDGMGLRDDMARDTRVIILVRTLAVYRSIGRSVGRGKWI